MTIARGDVVVAAFPFASGPTKDRPALVIQADRWNHALINTVLVQITGRTPPAGVDTSVFIDPNTPDGARSGLWKPSWISCVNVVTVQQSTIRRTIGTLSPALMRQVTDAFKSAYAIP